MAMSKPTVTLTFAGDESKLTDSFGKVGAASQKMGEDVGKSSQRIGDSTSNLDKAIEKSDAIDTRAMGFRDTITGVSDTLKGLNDDSLSTEEKLLTLGMGIGDLASGFTNFLLPALGNVANFMKGGLASAFSFIAAHPLIFTLTALVAVFALLWTQSETFRRIVIDVFNAVGGFIKTMFMGAINGIVAAWNGVIDFFRNIPHWIGEALGAIGGFIGNAFKGGLNVAIDIINWFIRRANDIIDGINWISPFDDIPHIPQISRMHSGGVVSGPPGSEQLRMLQAGEEVTSNAGRRDNGGTVSIGFIGNTDTAVASMFMGLVQTGQIQIVTT
jgi:phage-related protein